VSQSGDLVADETARTEIGEPPLIGRPATAAEAILITGYLLGLAIVLVSALVQLWPAPTPAGGTAPTSTQVVLIFWSMDVSDEVRLLLLVVFTGALGGILHALRSVAWYIGEQQLKRNWLPTYITQPFVGSTLAFIFYLVVRGGFFSPQASFQQTSPFGFAAMAGLIGMFSPQAVLKLKEVAETILTKPPAGKDTAPQGEGQRQLFNSPPGSPAAQSGTPPSTTNGTSLAPLVNRPPVSTESGPPT